jgi:hypothetical protein
MKRNKGKKKSIGKKPLKKEGKTKNRFLFRIIANICYAVLGITLLYSMYSQNVGYNWLYGSLIKGSLDSRAKVSELTMDQRIESKLGFDVRYLHFINAQTPEDAVILFPPVDSIKTKKDGGQFADNRYFSNKTWTSYFIYPRKMIYETQLDDLDQITHVAIMNFWGYNYFPDTPKESRAEYSVLVLK